ncbi:RNA polymerase sigma-70 factor [uncultured Draconibacterium sp.]|uniref:RNA polymerase sigma factor n=1 Tax=uncultured Draconibacterium sp. TaxID=1573823 RepID=UPI00325FE1CD
MTNTKANTEQVKLLKKGDMAAFDTIYSAYCHKLYAFVLKYVKQEEDAEEIVQEVFVKIWESRGKIDSYMSFDAFLFTIAYNSSISLLRKRLSENKSRDYLKSLQKIEQVDSVIEEIQYKELHSKVQDLLNQLTPRQKEIYELSREAGLTHKEIATKLGISENTVKNHLVTTLKFLRSNISNSLAVSVLYLCLFLS